MNYEDFYISHIKKDIELRKTAEENYTIKIVRGETYSFKSDYVIDDYIVKLHNQVIFRFEMKTVSNPISTFILKNNEKIEINDSESTKSFIEKCDKFANKLIEYFKKIQNCFYISENTIYLDRIILRNKLMDNSKNPKIYVLMDDSFILLLDYNNTIQYNTVEDVISSNHIINRRKDLLHDLLGYIKVY